MVGRMQDSGGLNTAFVTKHFHFTQMESIVIV